LNQWIEHEVSNAVDYLCQLLLVFMSLYVIKFYLLGERDE